MDSNQQDRNIQLSESDDESWVWHPFFKMQRPLPPLHAQLKTPSKLQANKSDLVDESKSYYHTLDEAMKLTGCSANELLDYGIEERIILASEIPDEQISFIPYNKYSGQTGRPFFSPELLILEKEHCEQIKRNNKTEQSDFPRSYKLNFGKYIFLMPSFANPNFQNEGCVWRALLAGNRHHLLISKKNIVVDKYELQCFIRENFPKHTPQQATKSSGKDVPLECKEELIKLIDEIAEILNKKGLDFDRHNMLGTKQDLLTVAKARSPLFHKSLSTFDEYLECSGFRFAKGRRNKKGMTFYSDLFPELKTDKPTQ